MKNRIRKKIKVLVTSVPNDTPVWYEVGQVYTVGNYIVFDFGLNPYTNAFFEQKPGMNSIRVNNCKVLVPPKKRKK